MNEGPRTSARSRAYEWTRTSIITGQLGGGALLTEGDVALAVGVSRTPVREAFLQLESEGLLRLLPKRGALVTELTDRDVLDMLEARLIVEPWAAARVAELGDRTCVCERLRRQLDLLVDAHEHEDLVAYQDADRSFHEMLLDAAGNRLMADFYRTLRDRQLRAGAVALTTAQGRAQSIMEEHERIVAAVEAGQPSRAADVVRKHIQETRDIFAARMRTAR